MKTYIHPVITLPAGEVQVTFYDASKEDSSESTPDIIMEIGEVEEGFDMNLGELRVPSCEFTLANLQGYALSTLLDTENLSVLVTVDNDLYFYGDFSLDFEPDVLELEAAIYGQIRLQAVSAISRLVNYSMDDLYNDVKDLLLVNNNLDKLYFTNIIKAMTDQIRITGASATDQSYYYVHQREYYVAEYENLGTHTLAFTGWLKTQLNSKTGNNFFGSRLKNAFDLLTELSREFFFYPSLTLRNGDIVMNIMERDYVFPVTIGEVKSTVPTRKYFLGSITCQLDNMPDEFNKTGLYYKTKRAFNCNAENLELNLHNCFDVGRTLDTYTPNMHVLVQVQTGVLRSPDTVRQKNNAGAFVVYNSLQQAILNAYKQIYFDNNKWRKVLVSGLRAEYEAVSDMRYLLPGCRFTLMNETHLVHTVKRSLTKNESEVLALRLNA